jgi:hypothetical protein
MSSASKGQTVSAIATTGTNPTAQKSIEQVSTPQMPPVASNQVKSLQEIFERLKQGTQKKEFYEKFSRKLEEVEQFRSDHDGGGLVLTITNQVSNDEIHFSNLSMILRFIDEAILQGKKAKEGLEGELLNMSI